MKTLIIAGILSLGSLAFAGDRDPEPLPDRYKRFEVVTVEVCRAPDKGGDHLTECYVVEQRRRVMSGNPVGDGTDRGPNR